MPLTTGQILNNRYRIVKLLGQGGFGAVYKAWDLNLLRACALKENTETSQAAQEQFFNEAKILSSLRHPGLPLVSDHFIVPGQGQYLVMDFVEGHDLMEMLEQAGGRLPETQVLPWIEQVLGALAYLHSRQPPVIHRDIKPANIKITPPSSDYPQGQAMLVDFGIAKAYDPLNKTIQGARAYTPGYSPLEQYGSGTTDARSDLYALGATLYALLTGQEPVEAPQRMLRDPLVPPRQINPAISPAIEQAILRAMANDPEQRFQRAGEFRSAISSQAPLPAAFTPVPRVHAAGAGGAALSPVSSAIPGTPAWQARRSFPWKWVGIAAGLLAGVMLLAVLAGLVLRDADVSRLTQANEVAGTQTAAALVAIAETTQPPADTATPTPTETPVPTSTIIPSPLPPSPTSTASGGGSGLIAFASSRDDVLDIYVINADGSGITNLTNNPATDYDPNWSPDGSQIVFRTDRDGNHEIYIMNADGSGLINLTNHPAADYDPVWSPDGSRILFISLRDNDYEIYVMNVDGSGQTRLTNHRGYDGLACWSPDGSRIAYVSERNGNFDIYLMNADGSEQVSLTNHAATVSFPAWSPDGSMIAFTSDQDGNTELYVMNSTGSGEVRLTNNAAIDDNPSWSPDSKQIAFVSFRDGNFEIYLINADGSGLVNLTNHRASDISPSWAP